jgi:outer membrane protein OmpA-like peptidoglycan-associated protein
VRNRCRGNLLILTAALASLGVCAQDSAQGLPTPKVRDVHAFALAVQSPLDTASRRRLKIFAPVLSLEEFTSAQPRFERIVYFRFRQATPKDPMSTPRVADALRERASIHGLRIDGYADAIGTKPYNLRLSISRACNVARELARLLAPTVPPITVRGFGEAYPVATNAHPDGSDDPIGRARNRRVVIESLERPAHTGVACTFQRVRPSR